MPYSNLEELPDNVRNPLPPRAQRIWMEAYNSAGRGDQDNPPAVAWEAVKQEYEKDSDGNWVQKSGDYVVKSQDNELQYTLGIVYEPYEEDLDGHYTDEEEIRKAQWDYMKRLQGRDDLAKSCKQIVKSIITSVEENREITLDITDLDRKEIEKSLGDMHEKILDDDSYIVDNYRAPTDMIINGEVVKKGTWLLGVKWSDAMWEKIKNGERTGFSMEGVAYSVQETDEIK